jgi:hypothetical protein
VPAPIGYRLSLSIRPEPGNFSHGNLAAWRSGADLAGYLD